MAVSRGLLLVAIVAKIVGLQGFSTPTSLFAAQGGNEWSEADLLKEKEKMSSVENEEVTPRLVKIRAELLGAEISLEEPNEDILATKIVHFQRHGQGYHNLLGDVLRDVGVRPDIFSSDPSINPWIRPEIVDSPLTELGKQQCEQQRARAKLLQPQVMIVSPLLRAIQTAKLSFADYQTTIPWIVHEGCREELGWLVCNKRRPLSEIQTDFPELSFPQGMTEEDTLWDSSKFETETHKGNRIYDFLNYVRERPESNLAVVCHSAWLAHMCNHVLDCQNDENLTSWFDVSEIRSMKLTFVKADENA